MEIRTYPTIENNTEASNSEVAGDYFESTLADFPQLIVIATGTIIAKSVYKNYTSVKFILFIYKIVQEVN